MATSIWKGQIAFGMVSFPVKLCAAARAQTVSFHQLHKCDHSRIRQVLYCQAEDKPVSREELVKGFEYEKDRYVVIEQAELDAVAPRSSRVMEILEFVKASEVDSVYLDASYYVLPDVAGQKPYTLLFEVMRQCGYVSIAQCTMHNREHTVVIRPGRSGLLLHTMYYQDEVRVLDEFRTDTAQIQSRELDLAKLLVESLAASFEPGKYQDRYREQVREMIDAKVRGEEIKQRPLAAAPTAAIDILEALKKSLAMRKGPASEPARVAAAAGAHVAAKQRRRA